MISIRRKGLMEAVHETMFGSHAWVAWLPNFGMLGADRSWIVLAGERRGATPRMVSIESSPLWRARAQLHWPKKWPAFSSSHAPRLERLHELASVEQTELCRDHVLWP